MTQMSNASEAAILDLLFLNIDWAGVGDAAGLQNSAAAGSFYIALHTADPGEAGTQATSEAAYTGYARVAVARGVGGFTRTGSQVANTATVQFGECTAGTAVVTHFTVGVDPTGAGQVIVRAPLGATRSISAGITPLFNPGTLTTSAD